MFEDFLGHDRRMKQVENILSFRRLRDRLHQRLLILFKKGEIIRLLTVSRIQVIIISGELKTKT